MYFKDLNPNEKRKTDKQDLYFDVRILHSLPLSSIRAEIKRFMQSNRMVIKKYMLQCEDREKIMMILFSCREMDALQLHEAIYADCGIRCELLWKMANVGQPRGYKTPEKDKIRRLPALVWLQKTPAD